MLERLIESTTNSPTATSLTAGVSLATGLLSYLGVINLLIGCVAALAGAFIGILGAIKSWTEFQKWRQANEKKKIK